MSKYTPEACARAGIPYCQQKERTLWQKLAYGTEQWLHTHEPAHSDYERCLQRKVLNNHWRKTDRKRYWQSFPGYDGPPMRAPSGTEYWTHRKIMPLERATATELGITQEPDDGRKCENGAIGYANWYMEDLLATRLVTDRFDHPSAGGRGWCPKLARVGE